MAWHPTAPVGTISVRANRTVLQDNTTYIETTMGNSIVGTNTKVPKVLDHFWNVGEFEDGRHRYIQSIGFTSTAPDPDDVYPVLGDGMDTVLFPLETNGEVQWFHKNVDNNDNIYQVTPTQLKGNVPIIANSAFANVVEVPANVYGEIFMYVVTTPASNTIPTIVGYFRSNSLRVNAWDIATNSDAGVLLPIRLIFANNANSTDLMIKAKATGSTASWNYIITYRAL